MVTVFCVPGAVEVVDVRVGGTAGDRDSACDGKLSGGTCGAGESGKKSAVGRIGPTKFGGRGS